MTPEEFLKKSFKYIYSTCQILHSNDKYFKMEHNNKITFGYKIGRYYVLRTVTEFGIERGIYDKDLNYYSDHEMKEEIKLLKQLTKIYKGEEL